jgi:hypothetical protein
MRVDVDGYMHELAVEIERGRKRAAAAPSGTKVAA